MQCLKMMFMVFIYKKVCRSCILFFQCYQKTNIIIIIMIIIIIIIIIVLLNAGLIQSFAKFFTWDLRQMKGGMSHYLGGKILAGNYIIRDSSVFTYIESTFRNMWAVLVSTTFCISCSHGLPGIWSMKFLVPFFIMPRAPIRNGAPIASGIVLVLSFQIFVASISRSLYSESFLNSLREIFLSVGTV